MIGDIFDNYLLYGDKNKYTMYVETTHFLSESEEFIEPPKPQNSVKRWKREKKYF